MERKNIYVVKDGTKWKVKCDHCKVDESKDTQAEAIKVAKHHEALSSPTLSFPRLNAGERLL